MRYRLFVAASVALVVSACVVDEPIGPSAEPSSSISQPTASTKSSTTSVPESVAPSSIPLEPSVPLEDASAQATDGPLPTDLSLGYRVVLDSIEQPIVLTASPGDEGSLLATKAGVIWRLVDGVLTATVLDLSSQVRNSGERGFLGMALHPVDSNRLFVHYSAAGDGSTVVSEFSLDDEGLSHPESERVLFTVDQPASNHNGGMIQFGRDGGLYLGLGDGGRGGDQFGNAQNPDTFLGSLIRIDVDTGEAINHAIGLRNPWRFWIDDELIYVADVGQSAIEEVTVAPMRDGLNYGWPITEGLHCYAPSEGCETDGLTLPVLEVSRGDAGTCSIIGGVVYRGSALPALEGHYLYSDFCGGYLRSFRYDGDEAVDQRDWTADVGLAGQVLSFGVDGAGEVYVLTSDAVLQLVAIP